MLEENWLDAVVVWAVVAAWVELAVLDGIFCPVKADVAPCAAPTSDCRPDNIELAEIPGIFTT